MSTKPLFLLLNLVPGLLGLVGELFEVFDDGRVDQSEAENLIQRVVKVLEVVNHSDKINVPEALLDIDPAELAAALFTLRETIDLGSFAEYLDMTKNDDIAELFMLGFSASETSPVILQKCEEIARDNSKRREQQAELAGRIVDESQPATIEHHMKHSGRTRVERRRARRHGGGDS